MWFHRCELPTPQVGLRPFTLRHVDLLLRNVAGRSSHWERRDRWELTGCDLCELDGDQERSDLVDGRDDLAGSTNA